MALHIQNQIRNNAEEVNGFFQDMLKWEKDIQAKDKSIISKKNKRREAPPRAAPARPGAGTVAVSSTTVASKESSAAKHTYDVGYQKWEKMKISENDEMEECDNGDKIINEPQTATHISTQLTPASLISVPGGATYSQQSVPKALGNASNVDIETFERERGNAEFKAGNFNSAVKCYTKCLGLKARNYIAFSNRAMAYLKLKENHKAEADCTCALRVAPDHVKSLLRRASARSQLGKYRAAIQDLRTARELDPSSKQVQQELKKAMDSLKSATSKAPAESLNTMWETDYQEYLIAKKSVQLEEGENLSSQAEGLIIEDNVSSETKDVKTVSFDIKAGPDLPLPNSRLFPLQQNICGSDKSSPENVSPTLFHEVDYSHDLKEDNDGEWIVLTSPEKRSSRIDIVEEEEEDDDEKDIEGEKIDLHNQNKICCDGDYDVDVENNTVKPPVPESSSSKSKVKASLKKASNKKSIDKKKKTKKSQPSQSALYSIERSLLSFKGNDELLTEYLDSIDEKKFFNPPHNNKCGSDAQTLEVDVVVDLLLTVARCYGERRKQWSRVIEWFEGVAARNGIAAFKFVTSMLSSQQKDQLRAVLELVEKSCMIEGNDASLKVERLQSIYEL